MTLTADHTYPRSLSDDLHRVIVLHEMPRRIICLVPSITELLCDLGLQEYIVGVTKFCVHPSGLKNKNNIIGGTKNLRIEKIRNLNPDLIIANQEENDPTQVTHLMTDLPVLVSVVKTISDSERLILNLSSLWNKQKRAKEIIANNQKALKALRSKTIKKVAYLIWRDPWMSIGGDTYIHDVLTCMGYLNVFKDLTRYPSFTLPELLPMDVEVIFLSSEPYPFKQKHIAEITEILPNVDIKLVDGELYSWYGSRLGHLRENEP